MPTPTPDLTNLPFETALQQLEEIVARLERGGLSLEESLELYRRGKALLEHCRRLLAEAELKVKVLQVDETTGEVRLDPWREEGTEP